MDDLNSISKSIHMKEVYKNIIEKYNKTKDG